MIPSLYFLDYDDKQDTEFAVSEGGASKQQVREEKCNNCGSELARLYLLKSLDVTPI